MQLSTRSSSWRTLPWRGGAVLLTAALGLAMAIPAARQDDPTEDLKSKDPLLRLAAARAVIESGGEDAEKHLLKLLKDDDWEIVGVAATGLGTHGSKKSLDPLVKLAAEGPIRQVRASAALALGQLDSVEGAKGIAKKIKKDTAISACEALERVASSMESVSPPKSLSKLLKDKELRVRAAAARALVATTRDGRGALMKKLLDSEFLAVRANALETAISQPHGEQVEPILELLKRNELDDVLLRRALPALAAGVDQVEKNPGDVFEKALEELCKSDEGRVARRGPLLAKEALPYTWGQRLDLLKATTAAREHGDAGVRASAAQLLQHLKGEESLNEALSIFEKDSDDRPRMAALESILIHRPITTDETRTWLIEALEKEGSRELREALAVTLGNKEMMEQGDAVQALIDRLADNDWAVASCAAVSLGLTRSEHGVAPLSKLTRESSDWRLRGAGVVGLTKSLQKDSVNGIIAALADEEPLVVKTAHSFLVSIARGEEFPPEVEPWAEWWAAKGDKIRLYDPREQQERNKKYGYAASPDVIYRGLDVVVLESRGDHIQAILEQLGIEHRMTMSNRVKTDGLDASGVFVSNCTGELEPEDLERLSWFVKVGGYLCGSCWALTETIEKITPGVVSKVVTRDEILDNVLASPCSPDSPYTKGVFGEHVVPIYRLEGAHLIRVLQPERVEMLVDSVECAEKWGGGNLACWFKSGHGTILDSANHFHSQGFQFAVGLKKPEQRKAYAVDHMGTTLERIRETADEKFWGSNHKASEEILDYSVFRLVTNFVRLRRLEGR